MPEINRASDSCNMTWKLVDRDTGNENGHIDWAFQVGDRVKIRLENGMDQDHPMHHPFHIHGAGRFLVLARDGEPDDNLVWKDTVLVRSGETVDILLDVTNPGPVDGPLPHRRAQPGRHDVQLPRHRGGTAMSAALTDTPRRPPSEPTAPRRRHASHSAPSTRRQPSLAHLGGALRELADHRHRQHHRQRHAARRSSASSAPASASCSGSSTPTPSSSPGCSCSPARSVTAGDADAPHHRTRRVRRRLGRRRVRRRCRPAGHGPGRDGRRGGVHHAGHAEHPDQHVHRRPRAGHGDRHLVRRHRHRRRPRPARRRLPPRPLLVGIGVHRQRADRRRAPSSPPASWCPSREIRDAPPSRLDRRRPVGRRARRRW